MQSNKDQAQTESEAERQSGSEEGVFSPRLSGQETGFFNPWPRSTMRLWVCTCVYPPAFASEQVLSDTGLMDRWSSLSWQSVQVRTCGVSCPKVHEWDGWVGGGCLSSTVPTGSRVPPLPRGKRNDGGRRKKKGGEGRKVGWPDRERRRERERERVVSCKTLEERPLLSPWICSWMKKAVKYVFHSSLVRCHNKRIKEYCLRNLRRSRNGSLGSDDLRYCSVVFFYSPFNIFGPQIWGGGGEEEERRGAAWRELSGGGQGSLLEILPWRQVYCKWGNNKRLAFWVSEPHRPATPPLCPESSDYSSCTEHTFTPIKVSTENLTFTLRMSVTSLKLSCLHSKCFYLVVWPWTAKLRVNHWQIVLGKLTGPLCLLILLAPLSSDRNSQDYNVHHCLQSSLKKTFLRKYVFWG